MQPLARLLSPDGTATHGIHMLNGDAMSDEQYRAIVKKGFNTLYKEGKEDILVFSEIREFLEALIQHTANWDDSVYGIPEAFAAQANHSRATSLAIYATSNDNMADFSSAKVDLFREVSKVCIASFNVI